MREKILDKILQHIDEGVHFIDKDGNTLIYNEAMATLEQMNQKEVLNKSVLEVFNDLDNQSSTLMKALTQRKLSTNNMQTYTNKYGKEITTINTTMPILIDDELVGALEISRDVTRIKELSDQVIKLQKTSNIKGNKKGISRYTFDDILGESEELKRVISLSKKAAKSDATVLIYGETGTGKELISQAIHYGGQRSNKPFIAQNCAAFPESLLEGILFGTAKGGFTGAVERPGLFEQANGGTLLLDEINSMPIELQSKLLRVLQEGYVRRVGGTKDIDVDVRVIATTNEIPKEILKSNKIRKDLYYRLNVININIPPLRERKEDIVIMAKYFAHKYSKKLNKNIYKIDDKSISLLKAHTWPGNVRELENTIYSSISMIDNEKILTSNMLNLNVEEDNNEKNIEEIALTLDYTKNLDEILKAIEEKYIKDALKKCNNNISKSARILGLTRQNLQYKIKKYNIDIK